MIAAIRAAGIRRLLKDAPGPSPWYLRAGGAGLVNARGRLEWRDEFREGAEHPTGRMLLVDADGRRLLAVPMYARVQPLDGPRFLAWRQRGAGEAAARNDPPVVDLEVYDADALEPLVTGSEEAPPETWSSPVVSRSRPLATAEIRPDARGGTRRIALPEALRVLEEIFLLADAKPSGARGTLAICILVLRPSACEVEILPQDWFNHGDFDFGYQWITRVARDPKSRHIIGDGIRISPFRLDASGRKLA